MIFFKIRASHNGYEKKFGCSHKSEISLNKNNYSLFGMDEIIKNNHDKESKIQYIFSSIPGVNAVRTIGGENILIQIKKNKSLIFSSKGEKLALEKSLFFGGNKILHNLSVYQYLVSLQKIQDK